MSAPRIGAGIVGLGFIGPAHIDVLRRLGFVDVVAVAGSSAARAREKAAALHVERAYGDFRALIDDPDVHVVHVCTPNRSHYEIVAAALAAGKHVVAEKPLAMTLEEGDALVEQAARAGVVDAVNFINRGYPMIQQARAMIAGGALGQIRLVHGSYLQDWLLRPGDWNWRLDEADGGASRALADIGSHWCDLVQAVAGASVTRVFADLATVIPTRRRPTRAAETFGGPGAPDDDGESVTIRTEDYATVLLDLENGARGALTVSQVSAGRKNRLWFEIDGSEASLAWDSEQPEYLWFGRREEPSRVLQRDPSQLAPPARDFARMPGGHAEAWPDAQRNLFADVYGAILGVEAPVGGHRFARFVDGVRAMRFVAAALTSAREGRWVEVRAG